MQLPDNKENVKGKNYLCDNLSIIINTQVTVKKLGSQLFTINFDKAYSVEWSMRCSSVQCTECYTIVMSLISSTSYLVLFPHSNL